MIQPQLLHNDGSKAQDVADAVGGAVNSVNNAVPATGA